MEMFSKISNGGVVILTPNMCKELYELLSKDIAGEVSKYAAQMRDKQQKKKFLTYK